MKITTEILRELGTLTRNAKCLVTIDKRDNFSNIKWYSEEDIKKIIGKITLIRGITPECNIHNAINKEKMRIQKELFGDE